MNSVCIHTLHAIVDLLAHDVPQILINKEALPHLNFDVELLGYSDDVVRELTRHMKPDWEHEAGLGPHLSSEEGEWQCRVKIGPPKTFPPVQIF